MIKQLAAVFGRDNVEAAYKAAGLSEDIRAERVTLEQFRTIAECFQKIKNSQD